MNPAPFASSSVGPPVNPVLGTLVLADDEDLDFVLEGPLALAWQRLYYSGNARSGWLGRGWRTQFEVQLLAVPDQAGVGVDRLECVDGFGRLLTLPTLPLGGQHVVVADGITLRRSEQGAYTLETVEGLRYVFAERVGDTCALAAVMDRNGNAIRLARTRQADQRELIRLSCSGGQEVALYLDGGRLRQVAQLRQQGDQWQAHVLCRYDYDGQGNLTRVFNRAGECMRAFKYNDEQLLSLHAYAGSFEAWFEYDTIDGDKRIVKHGDNVGQHWQLRYAPHQTSVTDQDGRTWLFHLDGQRRWTGLTDPLGNLTRYGLDRNGKVRAVIDPLEHVTETVYDDKSNPVEIRDPMGGVTQIEWHPELGLPVAIIDPLGRATKFEYDDKGNLISEIEADGATTTYELAPTGLPIQITDARGGVSKLAYNQAAQLTQYTDCSERSTRYEYDDNGWLVAEVDSAGQRTRHEYNAAGRLSRVVEPDGGFEAYETDLADRPTSITNAVGARTVITYAPDGMPLEQVDAMGGTLRFSYTNSRRLRQIINENGASHLFGYDAADRLIEKVMFDGSRVNYAYDAVGHIVATVESPDATGAILTRYRRDPVGRLLERSTPSTTTLFTYDLAGQLTQARNRHSWVQFVYDDVGQIVEERLHTAQGSRALKHAHDELGNRLATILPGGRAIKRLYYGSGHLHQVSLQDQVVSDLERDALHREISRTQGRLVSTRQLDPMNRLRALQARHHLPDSAGPLVFERRYDYDAGGRPVRTTEADRAITHAHDLLDRLVQSGSDTYRYDPAHNMQVGGTGPAPVWRHNRVAEQGDTQFVYDVHGRVIEKRMGQHVTLSLVWDDEHKLVRSVRRDQHGVCETNYLYDPFGRRIAKQGSTGTVHYLWDEDRLLLEEHQSHRQIYVYEPDNHVPMAQAIEDLSQADQPFRLQYYHCDQVGLPQTLTDEDGRTIWSGRYTAWGQLSGSEGEVPQRLRHQGQQWDEETGLHYNFQRYYDPEVGRFLSKDPVGLFGGLNEYRYVPSPLFWIDPSGLTGTYIMSGGPKRNYIGKGPKVRSSTSKRARLKGCPKTVLIHKDYKDDEMGFMVEHLLMEKYDARDSPNWHNSNKLNSPGKKKFEAATPKRKAEARRKAKALADEFEKQKTACGL